LPNEGSATEGKNAARRISVVRDQHLVPLLASAQDRGSGEQPWKGVLLERHVVQRSEIPEHEHPDLCLHLQLSGDDRFEWWSAGRNAIEATAPGSMILIPPGTRDRLRWQGRSERIIVSVDGRGLAELAHELGAATVPEFRGDWALHDPSMQRLVAEMGKEARNGWPLGTLYADLLSMGMESQLLRSHAIAPVKSPAAKGGLSLPRLKRAMEYMNANLMEDVQLQAVAKELELSSSHFAHEFRNSTGQTPYQYLLDQRMAKAKGMLRDTRWPVQYISELTGFRSPVNFVRAFRQREGRTPDAWRRDRQGK